MSNPTAVENYETLAFALKALCRWQRRHGLLGRAVLTLKDSDAGPLVEAAMRAARPVPKPLRFL